MNSDKKKRHAFDCNNDNRLPVITHKLEFLEPGASILETFHVP
jgi:hypothetical protein